MEEYGLWDLRLEKWLGTLSLGGRPNRIMENSGDEGDVDYGHPDQEVSAGQNIRRDCSCGIFTKNIAGFCPCAKNLPEAKLMSIGLVALTEKISKHITWLVVITPMQIYNEM